MGTTADKLTYLNNTKELFKDRLNSLGAEITSATTFRNYLTWLNTFYEEVSDKTDLSANGVVGRTSQETTTGKNLLNYVDNLQSSINGITNTINSDGSITTTGIPNRNYVKVIQVLDLTDLLKDNTYYTISQTTPSDYVYAQANIRSTGGTYTYQNSKSGSLTFLVNKSSYNKYEITIQTTTTTGWGESSRTITNSYQLEEGQSATSYEPFTNGASPNPDYPQPINNLSGDVDYTIRGKNLWDYRAVPRSDNLTLHGITYVINDDGSITLNGTSTGQYIGLIYDITLPAGTYYIGGCPDGGSSQGYNVCVSWGNGTYIIVAPSKNAMQSFTLTEETTIQFWAVRIGGNTVTFNNTVFYPMLYTVNDNNYEPYIEPKTVTIPLGDIELCKIDTYEDKIYSSNGRFYLYKETDKVILNGSENWEKVSGTSTTDRYFVRNLMSDRKTGLGIMISNYFSQVSSNQQVGIYNGQNVLLCVLNISTVNDFKTWLSTHNTIVYYVLAAPTTTEITEENYPLLYNALKQIQDYLTAYKINKEFILGYSSPEIEY